MSTGTFAEILREKLQNSQRKSSINVENDTISQAKLSVSESLELLKLKTRILESSPQSFISTQPKVNETPYHRFQTKKEYISSPNERAKTEPSAGKTTQESVKVNVRSKGVPHKLNDIQTRAMTYFIEEKVFLLEDFTPEELRKGYRKLALFKHPDKKEGSTHEFLLLKKNYEILSGLFKKQTTAA